MKFKTTKKEILEKNFCYSVGYCEIPYLLHFENPIAYTCGVYGWNSDIYIFDGNIAIVTGYRPFDNMKKELKYFKKYEEKAKKIVENHNISYEKSKEQVTKLLYKMIKELRQEIIKEA